MRRLLPCALALLLGLLTAWAPVLADPPSRESNQEQLRLIMEAKLSLAKMARSRDAVACDVTCMTDLKAATDRSIRENKPLMVWVGGCDKDVKRELDTTGFRAVHVHASNWCGDSTPKLIFPLDKSASTWTHIERNQLSVGAVNDMVKTYWHQPTAFAPPPPPTVQESQPITICPNGKCPVPTKGYRLVIPQL